MRGKTYDLEVSIEVSAEELQVMCMKLDDGRVVADVILGHVADMIETSQGSLPCLIDARIPHLQSLPVKTVQALPYRRNN